MRERPILFSGEMVRAVLEGRKSQTRRVINPRIYIEERFGEEPDSEVERVIYQSEPEFGPAAMRWLRCPYGLPGDRLWVRETCIISPKRFDGARSNSYNVTDRDGDGRVCQYIATTPDTDAARDYGLKVTPSIHMPRWASRITLEVTGVRVERVQQISEEDTIAEGCCSDPRRCSDYYSERRVHRRKFQKRWDNLNAKRGYGWDANPWVWVVQFKEGRWFPAQRWTA